MPQNYGWLTQNTLAVNGTYFKIPHTITNVNAKSILVGTLTISETFWYVGDSGWDAIMVNPGYYDSTATQNTDSSGYYITNSSIVTTTTNDKLLTPLGRIGVGAIVAAHWLFFFESIKLSNVSVAVVCLATSSLFSALIEPFVFKRKMNGYELLFGIVVIAALAFALKADVSYFWGYLYGVIAAFLATLFTIFNALYINKVEASKITLIEMLGGWIAMSIYIVLFTNTPLCDFSISQQDTIYLIALGIVCTAFAFVVSVEVMKSLSPYSVIMAVNLEPIYSIVLALILFGESEEMTSSFYIGGSIIILTVFLDGYLKTKMKVIK